MTFNELVELLKSNGFKTTQTRKIILNKLIEESNMLRTPEELYQFIISDNPKINRSTVYRNIELLLDLNLLHKSISKDGQARYKLICHLEHHHHLVCDICGKTIPYDACDYKAYQDFALKHGFILTGHTLELHGICETCKKTSN
jgi:Fe2+ or Zn2+ uptake regulation protein